MLNRIIKFSLTNRVTVLIVTGVLLLWGCYILLNTDVDIFPDLNAPTVVVMTEAPGYTPEEVERCITFPIETAVNGASGVKRVRSSSATGFSVVWVEFEWGEDNNVARQTVSERLSGIEFPKGVGRPVLGPQSSILGEIMIVGLQSDSLDIDQLRTIADKQVSPGLLALRGVAQVSVLGGNEQVYRIEVSPERMSKSGVTMTEVMSAIEGLNDNASGGVIYQYGNEYLVKSVVGMTQPDYMAQAVVVKRPGEPSVILGDVADIYFGPSNPSLGVASLNAKPAVLLTITKQPDISTLKLSGEIDATFETMSHSILSGVKVNNQIFRQDRFIDSSISNLRNALFEGAIFVIIVLFFFLTNVRTTLISLIALPLSIILTVIILRMLGLGINTMSLGGIAIAIGSLVDDAIVDVENVWKKLLANAELPQVERKSKISVIYEASREVRTPILNSSLIIIAGFLPLFFLGGLEGRLLIPLGISFIIALIASTIVALTLTPVLCVYLLKVRDSLNVRGESRIATIIKRHYQGALKKALSNPKVWMTSVGVLFAVALVLFFSMPTGFLPAFNEGSFTINVSTLPGISLEESDRIGRLVETKILENPEIELVARKTGRAELDEHSLGVSVSELEAPYTLKDRTKAELVTSLRESLSKIPGVIIEIGSPISHRIDAMLSGTEANIAIKIFGPELDRLFSIGNNIAAKIKGIDGIADVNVEQQVLRPEIEIRPRLPMLAAYGISISDFQESIRVLLGGRKVSQVFDAGLPYDIVVQSNGETRNSIESIKELLVDTPVGQVPLTSVADVISSMGPNTINRENVSRRIVVSANVAGGDLGGVARKINEMLSHEVDLPNGYRAELGGQYESQRSATRTLILASLIALLIIIIVLYSDFKQLSLSFLILINMPLAMIGGVVLLWMTGGQINIPAIIGFISLLGISTRNGMLLLSKYKSMSEEALPRETVILKGSNDRFNPIIMTALSSALALLPIALRGSLPGNEIQSPLAIVILGGLFSSTLLNLFITPILYNYLKK